MATPSEPSKWWKPPAPSPAIKKLRTWRARWLLGVMASVYLLGPWMSPIQASDDPHDAYMFFYAVHGVAGAIICVAAVFAMKLLGVPFGRLERWRKNRVTMRRISAPAYPTTETTDRADRRDSVDI